MSLRVAHGIVDADGLVVVAGSLYIVCDSPRRRSGCVRAMG